jgi:hypothetical protein
VQVRARGLAGAALEQEASRQVSAEYVRRVCAAVEGSGALAAIGEGIPRLLASQLRAGVIAQEALERTEQALAEGQRAEERRLRESYPVRSRVAAWLARRLAVKKAEQLLAHQWSAHEAAVRGCREAGLAQHAYLLGRDLSFLQHQEPVLATELRRGSRVPSRTFEFRTRIWRPAHWEVTAVMPGGQSETIPTVVLSGPSKTSAFIQQSAAGASDLSPKAIV